MKKTIIKFGDIEVQKKILQHKEPISIKNIDINKIVVSNRSLLAKVLSKTQRKDIKIFLKKKTKSEKRPGKDVKILLKKKKKIGISIIKNISRSYLSIEKIIF